MPERDQFMQPEEFYATLAHESIHATGHTTWLNRDFVKRYGNDIKTRAFEELVAEIGSVQLAMETGFSSKIDNHACYIDKWLTVLKSDKKTLFNAAAKSAQAVDYVMGRQANDARAEAKDVSTTAAHESLRTKPSLPSEIAAPASEALSDVSAKMKKLRAKQKIQVESPSVSKCLGM
jgi:antirestriction protein ArdC